MTVGTPARRIAPVTGNSSTRRFSFSPMVIYANDELEVVTTVTATGIETVISRGTGATTYSISITSFPGTGSIDYPASGGTLLPSTETITIRRVPPLEQLIKLKIQGGWDPQQMEDALDKIIHMILKQQEELDRCLRLPLSYEVAAISGEIDFPLGSDARYLSINAARDAIAFGALTGTSVSNFMINVLAALTATAARTLLGAGTGDGTMSDLVDDLTPQLGGDVDGQDKTVSNINLKDYGEITFVKGNLGATPAWDLEDGNFQTCTADQEVTSSTMINWVASDEFQSLTLALTNGGAATLVWPTSVDWDGGSAPSLTAAGVDFLVFWTYDGGTTVHGAVASTDSK